MPPPCKLNIEDQFDKEADGPDITITVKEALDSPLTGIMKEPLTVKVTRFIEPFFM